MSIHTDSNETVYTWIVNALAANKTIQVTTYYKSNLYTRVEDFKVTTSGVFVRRGKKAWDCIYNNGIAHANIRAITY